jgi:hypothetical protein
LVSANTLGPARSPATTKTFLTVSRVVDADAGSCIWAVAVAARRTDATNGAAGSA